MQEDGSPNPTIRHPFAAGGRRKGTAAWHPVRLRKSGGAGRFLSERSTMWSPSNSNTSNVVSSDGMPNTSNCSCPGRSDWSPLILKS